MRETQKNYPRTSLNKKMMRSWGIVCYLVLLWGCKAQHESGNRNVAVNYDPKLSELHPEFILHKTNETEGTFYAHVPKEQLLFVQQTADEPFTAHLKIHWTISLLDGLKSFHDSASYEFSFKKSAVQGDLLPIEFKAQIPKDKTFLIEMDFTDQMTKAFAHRHLVIDIDDPRYNYLVRNENSALPLINSFIAVDQGIQVSANQPFNQPVEVKFYPMDQSLALPPFTLQTSVYTPRVPDSTFTLSPNNSSEVTFTPSKAGIYAIHIRDAEVPEISLLSFDNGFPYLTHPSQLVEPLRYLTSKKEFSLIVEGTNPRKEVDQFWQRLAKDKEQARALIQAYYGRIQTANLWFSSDREGWRTDRGLVYTIFGPPGSVTIEKNKEMWLYGEEGNYMSWNFIFNKVDNSFSQNDYKLLRSPNYKTFYHQAVETWREGRVFTSK